MADDKKVLGKLAKTIGSVTLAAGALLSNSPVLADTNMQRLLDTARERAQMRSAGIPSTGSGQLMLAAADGPSDLLAGHGSHRSHSSHASHASHASHYSGGGVTPLSGNPDRPSPPSSGSDNTGWVVAGVAGAAAIALGVSRIRRRH